MATYSNPHWLLSHIRNSFISTDDTGMCETVMVSDDMPKHYLRKFQGGTPTAAPANTQHHRLSGGSHIGALAKHQTQTARVLDPVLQEVDFICYPGLDQSDDEDIDLSTQSYDIQMYPEVGAHRLRSNTAQKLEKMDIARRKAARTKCVKVDDEVIPPERSDFFVRKQVNVESSKKKTKEKLETEVKTTESEGAAAGAAASEGEGNDDDSGQVRSKLSLQLLNSPKQAQNKFMEFARFDGTSQTGMQTKRINVFLSMLPERERNYPIKICVIASAKVLEVIGLICYKATIQFPDIPLKSIRHYALYMTEDNDDMEDFPPLDNREPCSKFGFSHLTLAERRPLMPVTRIDYNNLTTTRSMTSEEDKARLAAAAVRSLQGIDLNGSGSGGAVGGVDEGEAAATSSSLVTTPAEEPISDYEERMLNHTDMLEAPMYRTYRVKLIDKRFFKSDVSLGISGERIEIDHHKNAKFWTKQRAVTYPIDAVAFCEITEFHPLRAHLRIWLKSSSSSSSPTKCFPMSGGGDNLKTSSLALGGSSSSSGTTGQQSPTSPHYSQFSSPFQFFHSSSSAGTHQHWPHHQSRQQHHHLHIRFKHYDFEADLHTAEQILNKLNCILEVRSSEVRREFLLLRERKTEKTQAKKQLKM